MRRSAIVLICFVSLSPVYADAQCFRSAKLIGSTALEFMGYALSDAGDVDRDGFEDYIAGAYLNDDKFENGGIALVISGGNGFPLHTFWGREINEQFGIAVSGAGDVNGDGFADLIVGARLSSASGQFAGRAYVHSGQSGDELYRFTGERAGDFFGAAVADAGDVNNDGFSDMIVGAPQHDVTALKDNAGRAYVFSGKDGELLRIHDGEAQGNQFGWSVAGAGDINADGYDDVIVGAKLYDGWGLEIGRAYVYSGRDGSLLWMFEGENDGERLGWSVDGAGDINQDGYDDLLIGGPNNDRNGDNAGRVYVYSGKTAKLLYALDGEMPNAWFGFSVAGKGDLNGDSFPDIVVGAPRQNPSELIFGQAYAFSGRTGELLAIVDDGPTPDEFGFAVANLGTTGSFNDSTNIGNFFVGAPFNNDGGEHAGRVFRFGCFFLQTDVEESDIDDDNPVPNTFRLQQNYPNPFNPETTIKFTLPKKGEVELAVYNSIGRRVRALASEELSAGEYITTWNGRDDAGAQVASGIYFYRLQYLGVTLTRKMALLK